MYFTNRIYADKDLPKAFKVNVSEESKRAAGKSAKTADKPPPVPAGSADQDRINMLNKQIGAPLPTSAVGHDYIRGIQSILNSVMKDPLEFWKKKVSVYKTRKFETAASFWLLCTNISTHSHHHSCYFDYQLFV